LPLIEVDQLTKRFGDVTALTGLSFSVNRGEVFGLLGHNGAGKTTTVRLLNGLLAPDHGTIRVGGLSPFTDGVTLRATTGVLPESPALDERLTGRENLAIFADLFGIPPDKIQERLAALLRDFGLSDRADERVGNYSKGMKQRLALARTLLHEPEILYLDEPTAGLDPVAAHQVQELVTALSAEEGRTVLLATHNLAEAQQLCDRLAVLREGRLVALGTHEELALRLGRELQLEVDVALCDTDAAVAVMRTHNQLRDVMVEENRIRPHGAHQELIPQLINELVGAGVSIYRLVRTEPSLEDLYFAIYGNREDDRS